MIISSGWWTDTEFSIHWIESRQHPPVNRNGGKTVLDSLFDFRFEFQNILSDVFWNDQFYLYTVWNYVFQLYGIVGKEFFSRNDMWGNVVTIP